MAEQMGNLSKFIDRNVLEIIRNNIVIYRVD